ncbi:MAG: hypothetical protein HOY44_03515 [Maritimibacter sp.]|uniref:hypothetical protein n=1 Tax=Maritimibacter sp. TaxID=2003363 RepID=UPI001DAB5902|nr:hypothetical protein [Maritimibacter sp.]MBL6426577.1 hypothetical protein [Maritimibacter sp.]
MTALDHALKKSEKILASKGHPNMHAGSHLCLTSGADQQLCIGAISKKRFDLYANMNLTLINLAIYVY